LIIGSGVEAAVLSRKRFTFAREDTRHYTLQSLAAPAEAERR